MTVGNSTFSSNSADITGGGIRAEVANVTNSTFSANSAGAFGGGIAAGAMTVANSTFVGNNSIYSSGGGIYSSGVVTLTNNTFAGNNASHAGGGINVVSATVSNCTFSGNSAASSGGGAINVQDTLRLENTIVANNSLENCFGVVTDGGGNLSFLDTSCPGINADPMLGPLQDNGGPTWTMALGSGSAAIDAAIDATCAADPVNNLDQRGVTRPQGSHCDIGAVEQAPYLPLPPRLWLPAVLSGS